MTIEYYIDSAWDDISDYLVGAGKIPKTAMNRDFTPRLENLNIQIAQTLSDKAGYEAWTNFTEGDLIRIRDGAYILFRGTVQSTPLNYADFEFDITLINELNVLSTFLVNYDTLHSELSGGSPSTTEYQQYSYYIQPAVHIPYLLQKMFEIAGLTLDISDIEDEVAFNHNWDAGNADVLYRDFIIGEWELYCLGQNVLGYKNVIDSLAYEQSRLNFFDLVNSLCSIFGLTINIKNNPFTDPDEYILGFATTNFSIDDDDKFEYSNEPNHGSYDSSSIRRTSFDYTYYSRDMFSTSAVSRHSTIYIYSGNDLNWIVGLNIVIIKELTAFDSDKVVPISDVSIAYPHQSIYITTSIEHGLTNLDHVMLFGIIGDPDTLREEYALNNLNQRFGSGTDEEWEIHSDTSTRFFVYVDFSEDYTEAYSEHGWVYKDTGDNYFNSFEKCYFIPAALSADDTISDSLTGLIMNPIKNAVRAKITNFTRETILTTEQTDQKSVIENNIDIEWETSEIIQETYDA